MKIVKERVIWKTKIAKNSRFAGTWVGGNKQQLKNYRPWPLFFHQPCQCQRSSSPRGDLFATEAAPVPGDGSLCRKLRSLLLSTRQRPVVRCAAADASFLRLRTAVSPTWPAAFSRQPCIQWKRSLGHRLSDGAAEAAGCMGWPTTQKGGRCIKEF